MNERACLQELEEQKKFLERMGICFKNQALVRQAFTHSSFVHSGNDEGAGDYERLEFFGDSVISVLVAEYLLLRFPHKQEGALTIIRSELTNWRTLGEIARQLGLEKCIRIFYSNGIGKALNKHKQRVLGDVFEAFVGALALDQGYDACRRFLEKVMLFPRVGELPKKKVLLSPKSQLQIRSSWDHDVNPKYEVIDMPDDQAGPYIHVRVSVKERIIGTGKGESQQEAEEQAADNALWNYPRSW